MKEFKTKQKEGKKKAPVKKAPVKKAPVKKEDEVRPAKKSAPPIPKAKDFVKIGGRPAGKKVEVGTLNKGTVVKPEPVKKEEPNKDDFSELIKKISDPIEYLKQAEPRNDALTEASTTLLKKDISLSNFKDLIEALDSYHSSIGLFGGFSFKTGQAPPKWRKPLSLMVRKAFDNIDASGSPKLKKDWEEWTKKIPKKGVTIPTGEKKEETILKQLETGKTLLEKFLQENKGYEKKDYSKLKNRQEYEKLLKNYDNFIKGYNSIVTAGRKPISNPEINKQYEDYRSKGTKIRNTIELVYKYRKDKDTLNKSTITTSF